MPGARVIAVAEKLQYYQKPVEPETGNGTEPTVESKGEETKNKTSAEEAHEQDKTDKTAESGDEQSGISKEEENIPELTEEEKEAADTKINHKVIGIAVTPGGRYIGDVYSNNKVIDETGTVVGNMGENGEITDKEGNTVGSLQEQKSEDTKNVNTRWWQQIASGATVNPWDYRNEVTNVGPGGGIGPGGRYNPKRAAILSQLQEERRRTMTAAKVMPGYNAASYTGWQDDWGINRAVSTLRVNMDNMITADKPIPAVLARSLISLGEAPVTAIVERNVYGDSGRNVIIPAGSRVIGGLQTVDVESRFDNSSGGVKLEISWSRIIRPDGIAFLLDAGRTQTGDAQGRGGGALGYVDEQLVKKIYVANRRDDGQLGNNIYDGG